MDLTTIIFSVLSFSMILYVIYSFSKQKRVHIMHEVFFLTIYGLVLLVFIFPEILDFIENVLGIQSAINFGIYFAIFLVFSLVFMLYKKSEEQRIQISKLNRELTYLKHEKRKKN